jgi:hypothetical protein
MIFDTIPSSRNPVVGAAAHDLVLFHPQGQTPYSAGALAGGRSVPASHLDDLLARYSHAPANKGFAGGGSGTRPN